MSEAPDVSILVVNWNSRDDTLECLAAIPAAAGRLRTETVVVDNGSVDASIDALETRTDIVLVRNEGNVGFAAAVNQAFRRATASRILLLNPDVLMDPSSLELLVAFLDARPEVAAVGPLYLNPDRSVQHFHFRLPTFATTIAGASMLGRLLVGGRRLRDHELRDEDFSVPRRVPQPSASCLLLRRAALPPDAVLDERYPIYFNDVMLARSLADAGHECWVVPEATVVHAAHQSTSRLGRLGRRQYIAAVVRMLADTEPRHRLWLYRAIVFVPAGVRYLLGRPDALDFKELRQALAGDPGTLPRSPAT